MKANQEQPENEDSFMQILDISKSGYGGVTRFGQIVDRREHPDAVPIQENSLFGVPAPLPVTPKPKP